MMNAEFVTVTLEETSTGAARVGGVNKIARLSFKTAAMLLHCRRKPVDGALDAAIPTVAPAPELTAESPESTVLYWNRIVFVPSCSTTSKFSASGPLSAWALFHST